MSEIGQNQGIVSQAQRLQETLRKAAEAQEQNILDKQEKDAQPAPKKKEYHTNVDGCKFYFKDGSEAVFENCVYATDKPSEIEELDALVKLPSQHLISLTPFENKVVDRDLRILREVSKGNGGVISGTVNSGNMMPR